MRKWTTDMVVHFFCGAMQNHKVIILGSMTFRVGQNKCQGVFSP